MKRFISLLLDAFKEWHNDKASIYAAALSYYTVFSLSPLLLILISLAGLFFGQQAVQGTLVTELRGLLGESGADLLQQAIQSASKPSTSIITTLIGFATLLFGASGVFGQLKESLNAIFDVSKKSSGGIKGFITEKVLTFSMVGVIGFLLIVSLVISALISAFNTYFNSLLPLPISILSVLNFAISLGIVTLLFALIYKLLPDINIPWKYIWIGSFVTSLLFTIGKTLIGIYLGFSSVGSSYGAAASLVILLVWVYYAALIFFYGAEITQVYALRDGARLLPKKGAVITGNPLGTKKEEDDAVLSKKAQENLQPFLAYLLAGFMVEVLHRIKGKKKK